MEKLFNLIYYSAYFSAAMGVIILIYSLFSKNTQLGMSTKAIAGSTFLSVLIIIIFKLMKKRFT